ncbi:hypothetical protein F4679DRAFT_543070 [Xylaria curta]|nr:hypothetical protein F4679DRAFT_543070 [Xylaria curta]
MTPHTVRWGILATGWIAEHFSKDLLTNPVVRGTEDVRHELIAVASSTSPQRAADFIKKIDGPSSAKCYGSYAELVADPDVDIIHIATPHSHHFQNAMLAIQGGKNVLCEKALTVSAAQARALFETAEEKGVFFMEAVWTRFFPISFEIRDLLKSGEIGKVFRAYADLSLAMHQDDGSLSVPDTQRLVNLDLAGGALLDLGIYSLTWVFQTLYHTQTEEEKEVPIVASSIHRYRTGADESTAIICRFPKHGSMGIATTTMRLSTNDEVLGPTVRIQGSKGEIQISGPSFRPTGYKIVKTDGSVKEVERAIPTDPERGGWGHGMMFEADECARCLRTGKKQSETMPWSESMAIMDVMDVVLKEGGVVYPELIASANFDANSPLNVSR